MQAPTLHTQRLTLRAHHLEDFEPYNDFMASERSVGVGGPVDKPAAWGWFCSDVAQWSLLGFGAWAIDRNTDDKHIGQIALSHAPHDPERELGWCLYTVEDESQGYAHEAALAARDYAFETLGWEECVSYIDPANSRSIALAERLGAKRDDHAKKPDPNDLVYRHKGGVQ